MSDSDEAHRLKALAEQQFASGDLKSALKHAKHAQTIDPNLPGLPEIVTAFKIIRASQKTPTPDYYEVLQLEPFSHINSIKKQYKKLALTLHPDKNSFAGCEDAFKAVNDAMRVFSDKIRRQEYDMRLRIALQDVNEVGEGDGVVETFWTSCETCRVLHKFERRYLGQSLVCPGCKKIFKAVEVEEKDEDSDDDTESDKDGDDDDDDDDDSGGVNEEDVNVKDGVGIRASARIREKVAKGWSLGIAERFGSSGGVKRKKVRSVEEVLERSISEDDNLTLNDLRSMKVNEIERGKRTRILEEETMTLSEMQILARKKKNKKDVSVENLKEKEHVREEEIEEGEKNDKEMETLRKRDNGKEDTGKEMMNPKIKTYTRRAKNDKSSKVVEKTSEKIVTLDVESDRSFGNQSFDDMGSEKEDEIEKGNEIGGGREKRERRRVSRYGNMDLIERIKENEIEVSDSNLDIENLIGKKRGNNLEIMPVEDSDFHDFDKDRKARSFRTGQIWAVYDDIDGMPRHYALIHNVSLKPFKVLLSWLILEGSTDEDVLTWQKMGYHISCGRFKVSQKVQIEILQLFSHAVNCDRAAKEVYRVYPYKGSIWALYRRNNINKERTNENGKDSTRSYDVVIALSSYSDVYGLSAAHLVKVDGFKTVFKRRKFGPNAVLWLGKSDMKLFSHQIPAKKLWGQETPNLPEHCWELDPASLVPELLSES